jgi:hypothetical protein
MGGGQAAPRVIEGLMGKQYNKIEKRRRRNNYLRRKKAAAKPAGGK